MVSAKRVHFKFYVVISIEVIFTSWETKHTNEILLCSLLSILLSRIKLPIMNTESMIMTTRNKDHTYLNLISTLAYWLNVLFTTHLWSLSYKYYLNFSSVYNYGGINQYLTICVSVKVLLQKFSVYTVEHTLQ